MQKQEGWFGCGSAVNVAIGQGCADGSDKEFGMLG
jgi:hypothetical protein